MNNNVQFSQEDQFPQYNRSDSAPFFARMVIKMGLAKDVAGANVVLVIITLVCIALTVWVTMGIIDDSKIEGARPYAQQER